MATEFKDTTEHVTINNLPTSVKYKLLRAGIAARKGPGYVTPESSSIKPAAVRDVPKLVSPEDGQFGDIVLVQSNFKTERKWLEVSELDKSKAGKQAWMRARVHTIRGKGKSCFIVLRRGVFTVQGTMFAGDAIPVPMVKYSQKLPAESIIEVFGTIVVPDKPTSTTQSDVEVSIERIYCISPATDLPFQIEDASKPENASEKDAWKSNVLQDMRLNNRWIDARTPAQHAIFKIQSGVCQYFREFLLERNFIEVHTPKITPGVSEGGAAVFRLEYFGRPACLAQSPQLYKQMTCACSDLFRVFEIGPVFRAENANTHRHLCEFTGLDFEMEIKEHYHEALDVLGSLFVHIFDRLNETLQDELAAVNFQFPFEPLKYKRQTLVLSFPETIKMLRAAGVEIGDYDDYTTEQEKRLGQLVRAKYDTDFYIVDKYPMNARPFYTMPCPDDPNYTNSYDVFLRGEEITSGAQRIHDYAMLVRRAQECDIPLSNIEAYAESFRYGAPPHAGAGIGMERVVMLFLGLPNVRKCSFFPRDPHRLVP